MSSVQDVEAAIGEDKWPTNLVQLCPELVLALKDLVLGIQRPVRRLYALGLLY